MKAFFTHSIAATVLLAAATSVGAAEFWTYVPGNGQLTVNNPGGGAGFASVNVTGYNGSGGQFNGNFWDSGAKPADSFFRFFCIELTEHANAGPNPYSSSVLANDQLRKLYDVAYPNKTAGDFWNGGSDVIRRICRCDQRGRLPGRCVEPVLRRRPVAVRRFVPMDWRDHCGKQCCAEPA